MENKTTQINWQVKVLDADNRIIEMIGSTEDYDRASDKMFMSGAKLDNYLKNPVILANHSYGYGEKPTVIGKSLSVRVEGSKMIFKIQFAETDNAKDWYYLYANGYMNASSIGFIPLKYAHNEEGGYDFIEWELLELSMVAVPCNPNAVQRAFESGKISKSVYDLINKESEDVLEMKKEEVEALIAKAVEAQIKTVTDKHAEELQAKDLEIKRLGDQLKELTEKSGAKLSKGTVDILKGCCSGISEHVKALSDLVDSCAKGDDDDLDADNDKDAKEYSEADIAKMISENVQKTLEKFNK